MPSKVVVASGCSTCAALHLAGTKLAVPMPVACPSLASPPKVGRPKGSLLTPPSGLLTSVVAGLAAAAVRKPPANQPQVMPFSLRRSPIFFPRSEGSLLTPPSGLLTSVVAGLAAAAVRKPPANQPQVMPFSLRRSPIFFPVISIVEVATVPPLSAPQSSRYGSISVTSVPVCTLGVTTPLTVVVTFALLAPTKNAPDTVAAATLSWSRPLAHLAPPKVCSTAPAV